jgi:hypothetical protein
MSSFLCLVLGVLRIGSTKIPKWLFTCNVRFRGGLDSFSQSSTKLNKENVWLGRFICQINGDATLYK